MKTPISKDKIGMYDNMGSLEAILTAWNEPGNHPTYHRHMQGVVREAMPLLARALDKASK